MQKETTPIVLNLSNAIIDKLLAAYPDSQVKTHDLTVNPLPHLFEDQVAAFYTPAEQRTDSHKKLVSYSDQAIQDLKEADFVVIGVPLYNFNIPSTLKSWIDNVVRHGLTGIANLRLAGEVITMNSRRREYVNEGLPYQFVTSQAQLSARYALN